MGKRKVIDLTELDPFSDDEYLSLNKKRKSYTVGAVIKGQITVSIVIDDNLTIDCIYYFKKTDDIYAMIKNGKSLNLQGCYINGFNVNEIGQYPLRDFQAEYSFWDSDTSFTGATFNDGDVCFDNSIFGDGIVNFDRANFGENVVSFSDTYFGNGNISFVLANFEKNDVLFDNAVFGDGDISFSYSDFGGYVSFQEVVFGDGALSFRDIEFGKGNVNFYSANFGDGNIDFQYATFGGDINFARYRWPLKLFSLVGGYGTQPFSIILTMLVACAAFASVYYFGLSGQFVDTAVNTFLDALYYSGITFLTIGYGDIAPAGTILRFVSVIEGFLGLFLMSYLTVAVVRKILR